MNSQKHSPKELLRDLIQGHFFGKGLEWSYTDGITLESEYNLTKLKGTNLVVTVDNGVKIDVSVH